MDTAKIVRNTAAGRGRTAFFTPGTSPLSVLSCSRIILEAATGPARAATENREAALICLEGEGVAVLNGCRYAMQPFDSLYLPPGTEYSLEPGARFDLVEAAAPAARPTRPQFVPFRDIEGDPQTHFTTGAEGCRREVFKLLDRNVDASRLICGITFGGPGSWTGWPPHEHAAVREEVYLFIRMPRPAFAIQLVYEDPRRPALLETVFENDAVAVAAGYHPNLGTPCCGINYVWMMAAIRPDVDRGWSGVHLQEGIA